MNPSKLSSGAQLSGENPVNDPKPKGYQGYNKFNRSYPHVTTALYGDVTPFYVENTVERDNIPLASFHEVRTPTMVSPFLGEIMMKKAYFDIPIRSIYPLNYDLMRVPPVSGDDIPMENRAYLSGNFFGELSDYVSSIPWNSFQSFVRCLILLEKFFSRGSLFDRLGCHLSNLVYFDSQQYNDNVPISSFDLFLEYIYDNFLFARDETLIIYDKTRFKEYFPDDGNVKPQGATVVSKHYILELLRDNPLNFDIKFWSYADSDYVDIDDASNFSSLFNLFRGFRLRIPDYINIERLIAYQLACIEFMTDNHVDSIYTTDLFRQMMKTWFTEVVQDTDRLYFTRNGVQLQYDVFSAQFWESVADSLSSGTHIEDDESIMSYMLNILTIRKSLRYEDYFVGGRLSPLAVGDVNVPVFGDTVNAYEITRSLVYQRYLNSVNLSGPEFDEYSKDVLKNTPPPRQDVPKFLGITMSRVGGYEVENTTSDNQGKIVTNMRASDERFAFSVNMDHESILLGCCFFEVRRLYSKTADRHFFHVDREDGFNPKTQYLGDQSISLAELRVGSALEEPFAYGVRNGEFKQRFGVVSGGVVDYLKSWVMVTDTVDSYDDEEILNSDYIRSKNVEFDRFFNASNNSMAGWFHFVIEFHNQSEPIRAMDVAPEILL